MIRYLKPIYLRKIKQTINVNLLFKTLGFDGFDFSHLIVLNDFIAKNLRPTPQNKLSLTIIHIKLICFKAAGKAFK